VKSVALWVVFAVWSAYVGGCSFERAPLRPGTSTLGTGSAPDAATSQSAPDAAPAQDDKSTATATPDPGEEDAGLDGGSITAPVDAGAKDVDMSDPLGPNKPGPTAPPTAEPMSPMPLRCGDAFCPLVSDPVKACCTTAADVDRRAARKAGACGQDMSALNLPEYGSGCWQRDQLGIIDARCPSSKEPGCCADDGTCGTNNADQHLGCRHAPGSALRACSEEPPRPMDTCDPVGSYAMRVTVDTMWQSHGNGLFALTDDGRGPIQIYLLANIEAVDPRTHRIQASGRLCGVTLPPFYSSILCESYQPTFPESLWESPSLPRPAIEGTFECGSQGCVASIGPVTYLFGIRLNNPESPWPEPQQTQSLRCANQPNAQCFADDDEDGLPGVLLTIEDGGMVAVASGTKPNSNNSCRDGFDVRSAPLSDVPTAIFDGVRRTDRLMLGIRARVGGSMRFGKNCESAQGSAIAQYVNSRAKGCLVEPGSSDWLTRTPPAGPNERCTSSEARFIDESMPDYHVLASGEKPPASRFGRDDTPSPGPTVSLVRFAPKKEISCAEVRSAKF